ncbi:substrate-binding domain-containing protein [Paenibacillus sp. TAB 01]|uniref:LacI family DNA-binding transcriptional regulator n=1 Tax=Paenibacillus sp. TAB 01 TaxID=3368988 RepID=UPI003750B219
MVKKISMQQIADRLGVSKYTVSQALSGKPGVSHSVRLQIIELARTLGYKLPSVPQGQEVPLPAGTAVKPPSPSAGIAATMLHTAASAASPSGGLPASAAAQLPPAGESSRATAESYNSGLCSVAAGLTSAAGAARAAGTAAAAMPRLLLYMEPGYMEEPDFWGRVLDGLLAACLQSGWTPAFLEHAPEGASPLSAAEAASTPGLAGLIVVGKTSASKLLALRQLGLPMVLIDHEEPLIEADAILNANLEAARMACNHLLAQGCASIVFAGRDSFAVSFKERWWGCRLAFDEWKAARREAPLQLKKWTLPYGSPGWKHQLAKRLNTLIAGGEALPDGFLCANDQMALQLIDTLAAQGIAVPERCRVAGIDNIAGSAGSFPPLTTVELAKESLGRRAVQAMERKLGSGGALSEKIILSARLIVRQSG